MRFFLTGSRTCLFLAAPALVSPALAQENIHDACKKDVAAYCKDMKSGVALCMAEHRANLSTECKVAIADKELEAQAKRGAKSAH